MKLPFSRRQSSFVVHALLSILALTGNLQSDENLRGIVAGSMTLQLNVAELKQRILEAQDRIQCLSLKYDSYDYDETLFPKGSHLHRELTLKSPNKMLHVSAHGHNRLDWHDDFQQQRAYISNRHLFNEFPINRIYFEYEMKADDSLPGSLVNEFFFVATGIWPLTDITPYRPEGRPYVLREVAASEQFSSIRPMLEQIDGHWCYVLEYPKRDSLWIDAERGCVLLARESYSEINDALVQRMELSEHIEVAAGVWLPTKLRNIQFDYLAHNEEERGRIVRNALHTAYDISVDTVSDSSFEFHPAPGSLKRENTSLLPIDGAGEEHLRSIANWIHRNPPPSLQNKAVPWPSWAQYGLYFAPALLIYLLTTAIQYVAQKKLSKDGRRLEPDTNESSTQSFSEAS